MTAIKKFEIHLEHDIDEQYQYEPGEMLVGDVLLVNSEDIRVCSIQIQVRGEASVSWDDETTGSQLSAKEVYMDETFELELNEDTFSKSAVGTKSSTVVTVSRGEHRYPLEMALSKTLPSSFIGKYGSITYVLKATLREDKLMGLGTTITSEPFLVLRRLDIAGDSRLNTPESLNLSKRSSGFCFCVYGNLKADFTLNKTGHLPGDDIDINANIRNDCRESVKSIQASLVLNSIFHAQKKERQHSQVVNRKLENVEVEYDDVKQWNLRLAVPPYIPESRLDGCDMIDVTYELQIRIELGEEGGELKGSIPITIGTVVDERRRNLPSQGKRRSNVPNNNGAKGMVVGDNQYEVIGLGLANEEDEEDDEDELHEDDIDAFRHPMAPGEVRQNILFQDFGD